MRTKVGNAVHVINSTIQDFKDAHKLAILKYSNISRVNSYLKAYSDNIEDLNIDPWDKSTEGNNKVFSSIMKFYAKEEGYNENFRFQTYDAFDDGDEMAYSLSPADINFALREHKIDNLLNNAYNIKSVITHEREHRFGKQASLNNDISHINAFLAEFKSENFRKTTKEFQEGSINVALGYLNDYGNGKEKEYYKGQLESALKVKIYYNTDNSKYYIKE